MKKATAFLMSIFFLVMLSACGKWEDSYQCVECEEYFAESKLTSNKSWDYICYKCAFDKYVPENIFDEQFLCESCERYFFENELTYIECADLTVCYICAYNNTIVCPTCNEHIWYQKYDWLSDVHPQHITMCCNCDNEYLYQLIELQDENGTVHNICPACYNYKYFKLNNNCDFH